MSSLQDFLASLSLSHYLASFTNKGYTDVSQLFAIPDESLEQVLSTFGMLKGHAYKLKKCIENMKSGDPGPAKKAKTDEPMAPIPPRPVSSLPQKPGFRPSPSQLLTSPRAPVAPPGTVSPLKPNASLTKDVERLMTKLADIESVREDIVKAKELLLSIDVERFRKSLQQVEFVQKTLKAMEEVSAELNALETPGVEAEAEAGNAEG